MKILYRLIDIICHPSRIAMYFKDKVYTVIIYFLCFFALVIGVHAAISFNKDYIGRNDANLIVDVIRSESRTLDVEFDGKEITGNATSIKTTNVIACFNTESFEPDSTHLLLVFETDKVIGYYAKTKSFVLNYSDLDIKYSFSLESVRVGDNTNTVRFVDFCENILNNFESDYALNYFAEGIRTILMYYIIALVFMFIYSYLTNSTIKGAIRTKLIIYDSLCLFVVFSFALIFNVEFLQYVAFALPLLYTGITFRHIIRVGKRK